MTTTLASYPAVYSLYRQAVEIWPEHERFLSNGFSVHDESEMQHVERAASLVAKLIPLVDGNIFEDYRWTCERILEEEINFRRTGEYRLQSFEEVDREIYSNAPVMRRYINGLMLSQIFWSAHASCMISYLTDFLSKNKAGYRHLEIGPGHGLAMYFAAVDGNCRQAVGWEYSEAAMDECRRYLDVLGVGDSVSLAQRDVLQSPPETALFDSIVISEVLEHLEDPKRALHHLRDILSPDGRLFVNMPINSPAPDHIYLLRHPDEVLELIRSCGFDIELNCNFPAAGYELEIALERKQSVSVIAVATRDEGRAR